eukprot:2984544-Rhodomonas_salina.2
MMLTAYPMLLYPPTRCPADPSNADVVKISHPDWRPGPDIDPTSTLDTMDTTDTTDNTDTWDYGH